VNVILVAAEAREFNGLLSRCQGWERLEWPVAFAAALSRPWGRFWCVADGPGPRLASGALAVATDGRVECDAVVTIGFCGALMDVLREGDVVVGRQVRAVGSEIRYTFGLPASAFDYRCGDIVSQDCVALTVDDKLRLRATGAAIVDMEAAAVAAFAHQRGVPCYCVKAVTDRADEAIGIDLNAARDEEGRFDEGRIVRCALQHPFTGIPELWKLFRRSQMAARCLGDFLADCRF
jgi:adenosylhomocysteine nucleosidase